MKIPIVDLEPYNNTSAIKLIIDQHLSTSSFIGGDSVSKFEQEFADYTETKHAISCGSGTDAIRLILQSLGISTGDEVIVPAFTFFATAEAVVLAGATPVFADIDPTTYTISPRSVESKITARTKAIIPVHLYGQPANMNKIASRNNLYVIEDACQAHGATYHNQKVGSLSHAAAFSFYPTKNLGCCGDGGAITTNNNHINQAARTLRDHGQPKKNYHRQIGLCSRLDAIQAAILSEKLPELDYQNSQRRKIATQYNINLPPYVTTPYIMTGNTHVFHQYTIQVHPIHRTQLQTFLKERGIATAIHYPYALHLTDPFYKSPPQSLPNAQRLAKTTLSLPMFPHMTPTQVMYVCDAIKEFYNQ